MRITTQRDNALAALDRREFLAWLAAAGAASALPEIGSGPALVATQQADRRPNFVVILADDLGYGDLGCYGSKLPTPRLDAMAGEGLRCTDFYAAAPISTPSRAALLTGCYPQRVGLTRVLKSSQNVGLNARELTLAELLKPAGYATACIGKWHLGSRVPFLPTRHGFDEYFGLPYSNDMRPSILLEGERVIESAVNQETLTERYTKRAMDFITAHREQPFFLYLPHTMPHVPLHVSAEFAGRSGAGPYGDAILSLDWSTGEVLDHLRRLGLERDTLVIFLSDNGPWLERAPDAGSPGSLRGGKFTCWEGGLRVPCLARWPGHIPAGGVSRELVTMMDWYPTFARLAGCALPEDRIIDGQDVWPLLAQQPNARTPHDAFFYYDREDLRAVRSGSWKLHLDNGGLYDLSADPGESSDVAVKHRQEVVRLRALAERCREDLGDALTGVHGRNVRPAGRLGKSAGLLW